MAFSPILSDQLISYVRYNTNYRNSARENTASFGGAPVYFVPPQYSTEQSGNYGPACYSDPRDTRYSQNGHVYDLSASNIRYGNCTWWCYGRLLDTISTHIEDVMSPLNWDAYHWYDNYTGRKDRNANNIQPGDIIVFSETSGGGPGHLMFVEQVSGNTIYISHSAYSTYTDVWQGYACRVNNYQKSEIVQGNDINIYKGYGRTAYQRVIGVIHTGGSVPPTPTPSIALNPSSGEIVVRNGRGTIDLNITVTHIPSSESNPYPLRTQSTGLDREWITGGWELTTYVEDGVTYQKVYGKMRIVADDTAGNSGYVTFYKQYSTGYVTATARYQITYQRTGGAILFLNPDIGSIEIR